MRSNWGIGDPTSDSAALIYSCLLVYSCACLRVRDAKQASSTSHAVLNNVRIQVKQQLTV